VPADDFEDMRRQVDQLHEWHDSDDPETGLKRFITPPSLTTAIGNLGNLIGKLDRHEDERHRRLSETLGKLSSLVEGCSKRGP